MIYILKFKKCMNEKNSMHFKHFKTYFDFLNLTNLYLKIVN